MPDQRLATIDGIDFNEVWYKQVLPTIDIYNREEMLELRAMFTRDWDESKFKTYPPSEMDMRRLSPNETPDFAGIKRGWYQYDTIEFGLGVGWDRQFLKYASSGEITRHLQDVLEADRRGLTSMVVGALLTNDATRLSGWWNGSYWANEGLTAPPRYQTNTFNATHTHYYRSQTAGVSPAVAHGGLQHLREHGYGPPFVGFMHSNQWKNLTDTYSFDSSSVIVSNPLTDDLVFRGVEYTVDNLFGVSRWYISDWFQESWVFIGSVGRPPGLFIQSNNPSFRGLQAVRGNLDVDYPIFGAHHIREFAVHMIERGAGVAIKIAADNAAYPNPSYDYFMEVE